MPLLLFWFLFMVLFIISNIELILWVVDCRINHFQCRFLHAIVIDYCIFLFCSSFSSTDLFHFLLLSLSLFVCTLHFHLDSENDWHNTDAGGCLFFSSLPHGNCIYKERHRNVHISYENERLLLFWECN